MQVFLTGASGFLGTAFARQLVEAGHQVHGLVRPASPGPGVAGVHLVRGDLGSPGGLEDARGVLGAVDAVAHLGAVRKDWGLDDAALGRVNVASGPELLRLAGRAERFLFVSSVAVYGHPEGGPAREDSPFAPSKRYGVSKVEAERALREAASREGRSLTIVRPGIVYGPGDSYGMVANLARLMSRGRFLLVGRGRNRVNLLYIDDLARGLVAALTRPEAREQDYVLAGAVPVPLESLARSVAGAVGRPLPRLRVPEWTARLGAWVLVKAYGLAGIRSEPFLTRAKVDLMTREDLYDISKARQQLGFDPRVDLQEGLPRAVSWLRAGGFLG